MAAWCADAGAHTSSYVKEHTVYDTVQNATNSRHAIHMLFTTLVSAPRLTAFRYADAGADHSSYVNEHTGYDMVQNAANGGQFEAVVKLVEAGASWRLPKGHPRVVQGAIWYVPEILSVQKQMKVRRQQH
jgi:hypothetical protein